MKQKQVVTKSKQTESHSQKQGKKQIFTENFPLSKENYLIMAIGFLIIIIGYILMTGKENIFGFVKMSLSVIFVVSGFFLIIFGIMKKARKTEQQS